MPRLARPAIPPAWLGLPRRTVRLRLTLAYGGLFLVSGAVLLAITYVLFRYTFHSASIHSYSSRAPDTSLRGRQLPGLPSPQAQDARQHSSDLHQLLIVSGIALAVMAAVSVVVGWFVAGRALRPLRTITAAARDISATNLHHRIALAGPDDELKELGDTFDGLLARLQQSFDSQRQFVANASHELRTPLSLEQALLEAILTDPEATADSFRSTCERLLVASKQQNRLIEALLTLARSERGLDQWQTFDLSAIAGEVLGQMGPEIDRRGLHLHAEMTPAHTRGDPRLVERLVTNLVDNALRHNTPGGHVEVVTGITSNGAFITVANTGPEIPPEEIGRLLQPFQRLGPRRTDHSDGTGLGLSIVQAITTAQGAALAAAPRPEGGLQITVNFPKHSGPPSAEDNDRASEHRRVVRNRLEPGTICEI